METAMQYLFLLLIFKTASTEVINPVIVIDPLLTLRSGFASSSPFQKTTSNSFTEIIHDAVHLSETILIFVEENFSTEDISTKDAKGTPFKNIRENFLIGKAKYLPNVADPLRTLQRLLPPLESNIVYVRNIMKPFDKKFKYHYLYFMDPKASNETRVQMLRRHDQLINEAYEKLRIDHAGPVVMFYTGKRNPMKGVGRTGYERPDPGIATDGALMITDQALIRLTGVMLQQEDSRTLQLATSVTAQSFARTRLATRMSYAEFELDFNFEYLRDGWLLDSVVLLEGGEEVGRTPMGVGAPYDYSYYCSEPLLIVNTRDKSYVTISKYQLEPLRIRQTARALKETLPRQELDDPPDPPADAAPADAPPADAPPADAPPADTPPDTSAASSEPDKTSFTNTVNCGTNFNCRILAGLFVAGIVISITLYGIMMMCDCASNDRMDDANQKPLVIVAQL